MCASADHRAVRIAVAIGELVVVDVVPGPPQRPLLHRRGADERPREPRGAVHLERAVREVAVERQREADRAHEVRRAPQPEVFPLERDGEREQRARLDNPEDDDRKQSEHG
jgi:hypothetical protein